MGAAAQVAGAAPQSTATGRDYWVGLLARLAEPVLVNLAAGTLKRNMPVECAAGTEASRRKFTHLEAIARLLAGVAPWLEAPLAGGSERDRQQRCAGLARDAIRSATDPASPDFLNYSDGDQPVVDCGFLAQALLRAPSELWAKLDNRTQRNLAAALLSSRAITPGYNNWLLFSAMVETALAMMGEKWDGMRIDYAVRKHAEWYVGDGVYGDGPQFHWDYYNSFVIQPMLLDVLRNIAHQTARWNRFSPAVLEHARRYAAIQERLIAPDGTFPAVGRSIAYRSGAFQVLAQLARRIDRGSAALAGSAGDIRPKRLAANRPLGPSAAPRRNLHLNRKFVPLLGGAAAAGIAPVRQFLDEAAGRLDVAQTLGGAGSCRGPRHLTRFSDARAPGRVSALTLVRGLRPAMRRRSI